VGTGSLTDSEHNPLIHSFGKTCPYKSLFKFLIFQFKVKFSIPKVSTWAGSLTEVIAVHDKKIAIVPKESGAAPHKRAWRENVTDYHSPAPHHVQRQDNGHEVFSVSHHFGGNGYSRSIGHHQKQKKHFYNLICSVDYY
jgi:hypothetical protein